MSKKKNKGIKNVTTNPRFVEICRFEKNELKAYLATELKKYYRNVISKDGFLYVKGSDRVCLTAHMDTTSNVEYGIRELVKDTYEKVTKEGKHIISSPQGIGGDDRCGVYMILQILETTTLRPSIVFCEDEEIGCIGSSKFTMSKFIKDLEDMYFVIELDRRGSNDIVFYDDENEEFQDFVKETTGYEIALGSCSDISNICPECKRSGVNLSCGYYNEHHDYEYVVLEEMQRTLETTIKLIKEGLKKGKTFEYEERHYGYNWNNGYDRYLDSYNYKYGSRFTYYNNRKYDETYYLSIEFKIDGIDLQETYYGTDEYEMWFQFFNDYPTVAMKDVIDYEIWGGTTTKSVKDLYKDVAI